MKFKELTAYEYIWPKNKRITKEPWIQQPFIF